MAQAYGAQFARIYNTQWSGFARRVAPRIERFYQGMPRSVRRHRTLLDLCCGTGQFAAYFLRQGFDVTALDLSSPMLELAKENMRDSVTNSSATFVQADADQFQLDKPRGLVVATYNALNHLPDLDDLRSCFISVAAATVSRGCFSSSIYIPDKACESGTVFRSRTQATLSRSSAEYMTAVRGRKHYSRASSGTAIATNLRGLRNRSSTQSST